MCHFRYEKTGLVEKNIDYGSLLIIFGIKYTINIKQTVDENSENKNNVIDKINLTVNLSD